MNDNLLTNKSALYITVTVIVIIMLLLTLFGYKLGLNKGLNIKQNILNTYSTEKTINDNSEIKYDTTDSTINPLTIPPIKTIAPDRF